MRPCDRRVAPYEQPTWRRVQAYSAQRQPETRLLCAPAPALRRVTLMGAVVGTSAVVDRRTLRCTTRHESPRALMHLPRAERESRTKVRTRRSGTLRAIAQCPCTGKGAPSCCNIEQDARASGRTVGATTELSGCQPAPGRRRVGEWSCHAAGRRPCVSGEAAPAGNYTHQTPLEDTIIKYPDGNRRGTGPGPVPVANRGRGRGRGAALMGGWVGSEV